MRTPHQSITSVSEGVDRFFKKVLTDVEIDGPAIDAEAIQTHPLMIVSTHRSQADYFLAGHSLFFKGFKHMRFAAGDNLTRLPYLGPRFRSFGAFTVERESAFERNYVVNLCNQVIAMMEKREAVVLFPEGGRSYTGAMLEVKSGILGASVLLQTRRPEEEVLLLPMAISYECPPDAPFFSMLLKGKKLRRRSQPFVKRVLGSILYFGADILAFAPFVAARWTGRKYGRVYIDYQEPVTVRSIVDPAADEAARSGRGGEFFAHRAAMQEIAAFVTRRFLALFRLLPMHLVAEALSSAPEGTASASWLEEAVAPLREKLLSEARNCKSLDGLTHAEIVERGVEQLRRLGAVRVRNGGVAVRRPALVAYCAAPLHDGVYAGRG